TPTTSGSSGSARENPRPGTAPSWSTGRRASESSGPRRGLGGRGSPGRQFPRHVERLRRECEPRTGFRDYAHDPEEQLFADLVELRDLRGQHVDIDFEIERVVAET